MSASSRMVEKGWEGEMGSEQQAAQGTPATSPMFKKYRQSTSETPPVADVGVGAAALTVLLASCTPSAGRGRTFLP